MEVLCERCQCRASKLKCPYIRCIKQEALLLERHLAIQHDGQSTGYPAAAHLRGGFAGVWG